jgi:hypothetical protein
MLFALAEFRPYDWWVLRSERLWRERLFEMPEREYLQLIYDEWLAEQLSKGSRLFEAYKRYKAFMEQKG